MKHINFREDNNHFLVIAFPAFIKAFNTECFVLYEIEIFLVPIDDLNDVANVTAQYQFKTIYSH